MKPPSAKNTFKSLVVAPVLAITTLTPQPTQAQQQPSPDTSLKDIPPPSWKKDPRYAEIVINAETGEVLYAQNAQETRYIASITKVMTAYLAFEAFRDGRLKPETPLPITREAAGTPFNWIPLRAGKTITAQEAVHALIALSSNGAGVVLAEALAGTESGFAAFMTEKAKALGAVKTVFTNPHGLTEPGQSCSARDIAVIFAAVKRDFPEEFATYFSPRTVPLRNRVMPNCRLCGNFNIVGQKTGYTDAAGQSMAVIAESKDTPFVIVTLGATDAGRRIQRILQFAKRLQQAPR